MFGRKKRVARRKQLREQDVKHLWPKIWAQHEGDMIYFVEAACQHTDSSAHWQKTKEWTSGDHNPVNWVRKHYPDVAEKIFERLKRGEVIITSSGTLSGTPGGAINANFY